MIKVLVVHDTRLLRQALAILLCREHDLEVHTASWSDAVTGLVSWQPQVCVLDVDAPEHAAPMSQLALLAEHAAERKCGLLMLASPSRPGLLYRVSQARAMGYVSKGEPCEALLGAIRHVAQGEQFVDTSLGWDFLQAARVPLTERELSVLSLASQGASVAEIAGDLHLTHGTVRNYLSAITRKTGARNRVDAIRISQKAGWV
ncbi:response regulator transcription factor [Streptomyces flaveus]|uniref:response regulator transcription factor n=1 Tax=Streptomyces flaveus TaxID=66370 RepID=UPI00167000B1|nr:response regulator transcription factor [Streptomyces flaveus]